jgi:hypothetical protein
VRVSPKRLQIELCAGDFDIFHALSMRAAPLVCRNGLES